MKPVCDVQGGLGRPLWLFPRAMGSGRHPIPFPKTKTTYHTIAAHILTLDVKKRIIALCLSAGTFLWFLDALLDFCYKHHGKTFIQCLLYDEPIHDLFARIFVSAIVIALGFVISGYIGTIQQTEMRYQRLFNSINDAIFILSPVHMYQTLYKILDTNTYATVMFGYKINELLHLSFFDLLIPEKASEFSSLVSTLRHNGHILFESEMIRKNGSKLFAEISLSLGDISGDSDVLLIVRDITAKKRDQEAMLKSEEELRILASQLLNAQEEERQRISVGLHDELGQALMHLKFKLGSIVKQCQKNAPFSPDSCRALLPHVEETIEYVRRLSRDLSPSVLEEIGLTSSIEYLVEQFGDHYNMRSNSIDLDQIDNIFPFETQLNIFRIVQECLANAARHAQAASVSVSVKKQAGGVFFKVEDDGKGFDVKQRSSHDGGQRGIGISAMQQRVRMAGGTFEIRSARGLGTRVSFTIPLAKGV